MIFISSLNCWNYLLVSPLLFFSFLLWTHSLQFIQLDLPKMWKFCPSPTYHLWKCVCLLKENSLNTPMASKTFHCLAMISVSHFTFLLNASSTPRYFVIHLIFWNQPWTIWAPGLDACCFLTGELHVFSWSLMLCNTMAINYQSLSGAWPVLIHILSPLLPTCLEQNRDSVDVRIKTGNI